jgi:putative two-component system response regulator
MEIPPSHPAAKVFVVEPDPAAAEHVKKILECAGYERVSTFDRPSQVGDERRTLEPDLVILDPHVCDPQGYALIGDLTRGPRNSGQPPVLVLTTERTKEAKNRALAAGAKAFLTKPIDWAELLLQMNNLLETRFLHLELNVRNRELEGMVQARTADLWDAVKTLEAADKELRSAQEETIRRLSLAGEFREVQTPQHVEHMGRYCEHLARSFGLPEDQVELIRLASPMHDIGKIGVPDRVLMKPGRLTSEERKTMEQHTIIGHRILSGSNSVLLDTAATIALTHHERFDGAGYPQGLAGEEIPIEGRIAAIGDVFDAMLSQRPYRSGLPLGKVFKIMKEKRGTHFDPDLLDTFLRSATEYLEVSFPTLKEVPA